MRIIDLRSDTITQPTDAMRKAMAEAEVGDDVMREDPTLNRLEEISAEAAGKPAALFTASGTMGNLIALLVHCRRGDEVILGRDSHTYFREQAGMAALGGIQAWPLDNLPDGTIDPAAVEASIRPENIHYPRTTLVALENTHNFCNGAPLPAAYMNRMGELARRHGLKIHVDGARIFNAAVALNTSAVELSADADSICFCLSKGLSAPVGSMLCGGVDFIRDARRLRKQLGGGMRQAGVLAAAGILAVSEMTKRLFEDHENAARLARGLAEIPGLKVDAEGILTNIVYMSIETEGLVSATLMERLRAEGVLVLADGPHLVRAVTNRHISADDIEAALTVFRRVTADLSA